MVVGPFSTSVANLILLLRCFIYGDSNRLSIDMATEILSVLIRTGKTPKIALYNKPAMCFYIAAMRATKTPRRHIGPGKKIVSVYTDAKLHARIQKKAESLKRSVSNYLLLLAENDIANSATREDGAVRDGFSAAEGETPSPSKREK